MPFLAFLLGPIGRWLIVAVVAAGAIGGLYAKGRIDGKAAYQAKLTRQLNAAITKGNDAEAEALKKFDSEKELEDDGFQRHD
jgi:hypothetical protein